MNKEDKPVEKSLEELLKEVKEAIFKEVDKMQSAIHNFCVCTGIPEEDITNAILRVVEEKYGEIIKEPKL